MDKYTTLGGNSSKWTCDTCGQTIYGTSIAHVCIKKNTIDYKSEVLKHYPNAAAIFDPFDYSYYVQRDMNAPYFGIGFGLSIDTAYKNAWEQLKSQGKIN